MTGWVRLLAHAAGHDINYIASTGALHALGCREGVPVAPLNPPGDFGGGAMLLAFGVLCALTDARTSGHGTGGCGDDGNGATNGALTFSTRGALLLHLQVRRRQVGFVPPPRAPV